MAGTATDITGLYYTGGSLSAGSVDPNWNVTYASTNGGQSTNSTYIGDAYVIDPNAFAGNGLAGGWINNTNDAQWIVAPNAVFSTNGNGVYGLPGNGTTKGWNSNMGVYLYTLKFNITGDNVGSTVTNHVAISLTLAADDQWSVYINPQGNGASLPNGTPAAYDYTSAWLNTTSVTLANYGTNNNSVFKIGDNYLVVRVDNTNSITTQSSSTTTNPSGLFLYQSSSDWEKIDGKVVPELPYTGMVIVGGSLIAWFVRRKQK